MKPYVSSKVLSAVIALALCMPIMALAQGQGIATTKAVVQAAQRRLRALGYDPGLVDGSMGSKTISALKKFETDHGLPFTGTFDQKTLGALGVTDPKAAPAAASRQALSKKETERSPKGTEEERDWDSADAKATADAYLAFLTKYPTTQRIRVLSGEVSSGMRLDSNRIVWSVCFNDDQVADGLSTDEVLGLGLADQGIHSNVIDNPCSSGIGSFSTSQPGSDTRAFSVKVLPSAKLIMKNVDGSWKIAAVAPAE